MAIYVSGNTVLLLHGDGADASTVFTDETGKAVTAYGNAKISTAQSKFGGASILFDGNGDYLSCPHSSEFSLVSSDFTIEAWVYVVAHTAGNATIIGKDGVFNVSFSQYEMSFTTAGKFSAFLGNGNGVSPTGTSYIGATTVTVGAWHHVALVKAGTTCKGFLDGIQEWSSAAPVMYEGSKPLLIGYQTAQPSGNYLNGYIDDLRITKGLALYTANFTPPSAPLGLLNPVQVSIQSQNPGLHKLAKFDPSLSKPAMQSRADNLQNRMPYGPWKTPNVVWEFIGRGIVTGTVAEKSTPANTPLHRLVRLHREPDGLFVKATWSDPVTGAYTFTGVRADRKYFVTSFDYTGTYRAVIADNLTPELLP
jgi:hypothetical protein